MLYVYAHKNTKLFTAHHVQTKHAVNHTGPKGRTKVLKLSQTTVLVPRQNRYRHISILTQHINFKLNSGKKIWEKNHRR